MGQANVAAARHRWSADDDDIRQLSDLPRPPRTNARCQMIEFRVTVIPYSTLCRGPDSSFACLTSFTSSLVVYYIEYSPRPSATHSRYR